MTLAKMPLLLWVCRLFLDEKIPDTDKIILAMQKFLNDKRLPF